MASGHRRNIAVSVWTSSHSGKCLPRRSTPTYMQRSIGRQAGSADYWRRDSRKIRKCRARFHGRIAGSQPRKDSAHPVGGHIDHSGVSARSHCGELTAQQRIAFVAMAIEREGGQGASRTESAQYRSGRFPASVHREAAESQRGAVLRSDDPDPGQNFWFERTERRHEGKLPNVD